MGWTTPVLAAACAAFALGCGGEELDTIAQTGRRPPEPVPGAPPGDGPNVAFAIHRIFFGDTDRDGNPSTRAWKEFGYDLDGRISDRHSEKACQPRAGASPSWFADGAQGIDNGWGQSVLPHAMGWDRASAAWANEALARGDTGYLMAVDGLGSASDYNPLGVEWHTAAAHPGTPQFDGTDVWPMLPNPAGFQHAHLAADTLVARGATISLALSRLIPPFALSADGAPLEHHMFFDLTIHHAIVTMDISSDRARGTTGVIAGVLDAQKYAQLVGDLFASAAGEVSVCEGTTRDSVVEQIEQSADVLLDGSDDPSRTCDGISIGLGFEAVRASLGDIVAEEPAPPNICASAP